jgi:hypothetical protein
VWGAGALRVWGAGALRVCRGSVSVGSRGSERLRVWGAGSAVWGAQTLYA